MKGFPVLGRLRPVAVSGRSVHCHFDPFWSGAVVHGGQKVARFQKANWFGGAPRNLCGTSGKGIVLEKEKGMRESARDDNEKY